jgi:outer membrane immunogenic protein
VTSKPSKGTPAALHRGALQIREGKSIMKKLVLLMTVALGAVPAAAADLPTYTKAPAVIASAYDWSGFYIGINGGGGWSNKCWDLDNGPGFPTSPEGCHNATGETVGGQFGYRWQIANWVFGVEAQGNWANFRGSNISLVFPTDQNQTNVQALGLFTGQVGYAWNNALFYVKGGAANTRDNYRIFDIPSGFLTDTAGENRWGAVLGVGFEYGFAANWSVAFEYDHMFMGSRDVLFTTVNGVLDGADHIRQDVDLFTARINYKFGAPVVARY